MWELAGSETSWRLFCVQSQSSGWRNQTVFFTFHHCLTEVCFSYFMYSRFCFVLFCLGGGLYCFFEEGREKERERNIREKSIDQLPLACPLLGTWPGTQACALTGNWTSDLLVHWLALSPLSRASQGCVFSSTENPVTVWYLPVATSDGLTYLSNILQQVQSFLEIILVGSSVFFTDIQLRQGKGSVRTSLRQDISETREI